MEENHQLALSKELVMNVCVSVGHLGPCSPYPNHWLLLPDTKKKHHLCILYRIKLMLLYQQ